MLLCKLEVEGDEIVVTFNLEDQEDPYVERFPLGTKLSIDCDGQLFRFSVVKDSDTKEDQ